MSAGFQTANNSCKLNIYILAKPVTEQALPARLHGAACEATDWEIPWHTSELATCFMQRKLSPKSKNVACTQKTSIPNATLSLNQKELLLCRNTPKNVAKQEKYATLYLISRQKRCFRHPSQNPPAKPPHLPSYSRDFISFWYPAYKHAGIWHACMPIPLRVYQRERRRNTKKI